MRVSPLKKRGLGWLISPDSLKIRGEEPTEKIPTPPFYWLQMVNK